MTPEDCTVAEDNAPPIRFDDSAVMAALQKHWGAQRNRHFHMAAQPGSFSVHGMDAELSVTPVPDPKDLLPTLVMQTLILPESKDTEGLLIRDITIAWWEIVKLIIQDPTLMYEIPARKWEEVIAGSYEAAGYKVKLTPPSGDLGRDVIAYRDGFGSLRFIE